MIPGFGKQTLTIGSDPSCDIVLHGAGVASEHGRLQNQGGGQLTFVNSGAGVTTLGGRQMAAAEQAPFDFRQQFQLGEVNLPFDHPAIALCLMSPGQQSAPAGRLVIGRDPTQVSIVLGHPSVSSLHCSVALDRMMVTDHDSTSGTYVSGNRIGSNQPTPIAPDGVVHIGPVPILMSLLMQLGQAANAQQGAAPGAQAPPGPPAAAPMPPTAQAQAAPAQPQVAAAPLAVPAAPLAVGAAPLAVGAAPLAVGAAPLAVGAAPPGAAPAAPSGQPQMRKHKTVFGQLDFSSTTGGVKYIGRTPDNDIVVSHPQVSSKHAQVEQSGGQLYVMDRGSANGTYVQGHRIQPGQKVAIASGEKIYVGPMPLQLVVDAMGAVEVVHEAYAEENWAGRPLYEIEAWDLFLQVPDRDDKSKDKVLLDRISFKALPGDIIALMGPSGAGKTTLLLTLNGYMPPTAGQVRINGEDLYDIYDTLRGSIGYVPQDDLVHPELTVWEAVRYSAKFRLPPDYSEDEIDQRVQQTLKDLGLESVAHLEIGQPEKKILSGGQRKRVNIALELVTDPVIVYLDEPTSGLAADDAASLIGLLSELTKATGKTIIMTIHQPAKEEYEKFTHALILGYGGVPMFYGSTVPDSYQFFANWSGRPNRDSVDNPRDMFSIITEREDPIYAALQAQDPSAHRATARHQGAMLWREEYYSDANPTFKRMYSGRRSVGTGEGQRGIPARRTSTRGQFSLLISRYFKTKVRDVGGTAIMLAQAPIIGVLLAAVFGGQADETPAWCLGALHQLAKGTANKGGSDLMGSLASTQDHTGAVFFLVVSAIWFGTSNAAREIVRERAIYLRERMINLGLLNYVMSKFILLALFCILQCTMLLAIVFFALGFNGGAIAFFQILGALVATSVTAVSLGLALSTLVATSEAAMALTPIALIPQVVLGGLMVPATTIPTLAPIMYGIPARWGFEAAVVSERIAVASDPAWLIDLGKTGGGNAEFVENGKFLCATAQMASDTLNGAWSFTTYNQIYLPYAVLGGMTFGILVLIMIILKRRDRI